jgi:hypothetical protein
VSKMIPVNMFCQRVHSAAGMGSDVQVPAAPDATELDNWAQEAYSLSVSAATRSPTRNRGGMR